MTAPATTLKTELMTLENQYRDAMKSGDPRTLERLTADNCLVVGAQGARTFQRNEVGAMTSSSEFQLKSYRVDDRSVVLRELGPGVVAIAYRVDEQYQRNGNPHSSSAYNCSTWVKNGRSWECAVHTESLIETPH